MTRGALGTYAPALEPDPQSSFLILMWLWTSLTPFVSPAMHTALSPFYPDLNRISDPLPGLVESEFGFGVS
jgi:hypothetical protein